MSFVGFLVKEKYENDFENILKRTINDGVIAINEKSISNVKNVHFETIVIDRNIKAEFEDDLNAIIKMARYLIINADKLDINKIRGLNVTIITYGFNNKSTITASSVEEDDMLICLQRNIEGINGKEIECQELKLCTEEKVEDAYLQMALSTIKLLYNYKIIVKKTKI